MVAAADKFRTTDHYNNLSTMHLYQDIWAMVSQTATTSNRVIASHSSEKVQ